MDKKIMEYIKIAELNTLYFNLVRVENELLHYYIDNKGKKYNLKNILNFIEHNKYDYTTREDFYKKYFSQFYSDIDYENFITLYYCDFGIELPYMYMQNIFASKDEMIEQNNFYDYIRFTDIEWTIARLRHENKANKTGTLYGFSKQYNKDKDIFRYTFDFNVGSCYVHSETIETKDDITNSRTLYEMGEKISEEKDIKNMQVAPQPYWND